jgi:hypothetical protein
MPRVAASALCLSLLLAVAPAQDMPAPAPELAKLEPLIGAWQGKGTVAMGADGPTSGWTCTAHVRKVFGGHWIRLDETIEFDAADGEQAMPPLAFRTFYGFDRERQRYVAHTLSNMGTIATHDLQVDGQKIIEASLEMDPEKNVPVFVHWTIELGKDGYTITGRNTEGSAPTYVHVHGEMKRAGAGVTPKPVEAAFTMGPPADPAPMQKLAKSAGKYRLTGTMVPFAGQPAIPIGGNLEVRTLWDGRILETSVAGDEASGGFEGYAAWAWNARDRVYDSIWVDSAGASVRSVGRIEDGKMVSCTMTTKMGKSFIERGILEFDRNGFFAKERAMAMSATAEPYVCFDAEYERQQ